MSPAGRTPNPPSTIDLTIINAIQSSAGNHFNAIHNLVVDGPPRVLLDRVACHLKAECYKIISLNIGGPQDFHAISVIVISSTLSRTEMFRRGFEWHGLDAAALQNITPSSQKELSESEQRVRADTSTSMVRMDFTNGSWRSTYHFIRGALHEKSIERALLLIDEQVKADLYRLEALFVVKDWCSIIVDTWLTQEELRDKGFIWTSLGQRPGIDDSNEYVPNEHGGLVMPGWSRADAHREDDDGVKHYEATEWRDV